MLCRRKCRNAIHLLYLRFFLRAQNFGHCQPESERILEFQEFWNSLCLSIDIEKYVCFRSAGWASWQAQQVLSLLYSTSMLVDDYAHRGRARAS